MVCERFNRELDEFDLNIIILIILIEDKIAQDRADISQLVEMKKGRTLKKKITDGLNRRHPLLKKKEERSPVSHRRAKATPQSKSS